jgi:Family of unknown function (DUF5330)
MWRKYKAAGEPALQGFLLNIPTRLKENNRPPGKRVMRFLLKAAFWLTIVVLLLPASEKPAPRLGAAEAVSAASAAVSDVRGFCARQPDACAIGSQAAVTFGHKAQAGAKMLYEFLGDRLGPSETGSVAAKPTSAAAPAAGATTRPSQHTLNPADLVPAWRGAEPGRDVHAKRPA